MDDMCKLPLDYMKKLDELISNIKNTEGELKPNDFLDKIFAKLPDLCSDFGLKLPNYISWDNFVCELFLDLLNDLEYSCSPVIRGAEKLCKEAGFQKSGSFPTYSNPKAFNKAFTEWIDLEKDASNHKIYEFICSHFFVRQEGIKKENHYADYGHVLIPHIVYQSMKKGGKVPYTGSSSWGLTFKELNKLKTDAAKLVNEPNSISEKLRILAFYQLEKLFDFNFFVICQSIIDGYIAFHKKNWSDSKKELLYYNETNKYTIIENSNLRINTIDRYKIHPLIAIIEFTKCLFSIPSISIKNDLMQRVKEDVEKKQYDLDLFNIYGEDVFYNLRILVPILKESFLYIIKKCQGVKKTFDLTQINQCFAKKKFQFSDDEITLMFRMREVCWGYMRSKIRENAFARKICNQEYCFVQSSLREAMEVNITFLMYNYYDEHLYFPFELSSEKNLRENKEILRQDSDRHLAFRSVSTFNNSYSSFFPFNEIYSHYQFQSQYWYK